MCLLGFNLLVVGKGWPIVSFFTFTLTYLAIAATIVLSDYNNRDKIDSSKPNAESCVIP